jgi:hypothetical protein
MGVRTRNLRKVANLVSSPLADNINGANLRIDGVSLHRLIEALPPFHHLRGEITA